MADIKKSSPFNTRRFNMSTEIYGEEIGMFDIKQYEPLWNTWYVDSLLGKGAYGEVYKVRREAFGKTHYSAVKIVPISYNELEIRKMESEGIDSGSIHSILQELLSDVVRELDLMNELRGNSNIVSFEDYQVIDKTDAVGWDLLIRMEMLKSLSDHWIQTPPSSAECVKFGIHICRALDLCAQKNIIHRDIKPGNLYISQYGEYKLGDFGIARQLEQTLSGLSKKGTYNYMAPEVYKAEQYGANVDIYSLGIVMYSILNHGRGPFLPDFPQPLKPKDKDNALQKRMSGQRIPNLKGVDPQLNAIVLKACAYNPNDRFASSAEMREALEAITEAGSTYKKKHMATGEKRDFSSDTVPFPIEGQGHNPPHVPYVPAPQNSGTKRKRGPLIVILGSLTALAIVVVIGLTLALGGIGSGKDPGGTQGNTGNISTDDGSAGKNPDDENIDGNSTDDANPNNTNQNNAGSNGTDSSNNTSVPGNGSIEQAMTPPGAIVTASSAGLLYMTSDMPVEDLIVFYETALNKIGGRGSSYSHIGSSWSCTGTYDGGKTIRISIIDTRITVIY
jgi:serine/threonine protein kinase